jgi:hypothetical protein
MTREQAYALIADERYHVARQAKDGTWYVWDSLSEHEVEYDVDTIAKAGKEE